MQGKAAISTATTSLVFDLLAKAGKINLSNKSELIVVLDASLKVCGLFGS